MNKIEKISLNYKNYHVQGYKLGNDKTPVLLLHGGGVDNAMLSWREVMAILSENFTVYAYDHIGYGESDIASETMSVPFNVAVLEAVVEQLGLDKFILSGISMGGTISIGYTLAHSKKVMALILISPWGLNARPKYFNLLKLVAKYWNTPKIYKFTAKYPFLLKLSLNSLFSDKSKISDKLLSEVRQAISKENAGVAMWDFQKSSLQGKKISPDYASRLSEISVPTLFFHGDRDPGVPLADSQNAVKLIEDAKLHVMRNCKHWSQKERPEEYCRVLQDFINQLNSSSIITRS